MQNPNESKARTVLQKIAHRVMIERGLSPDFSPAALVELGAIHGAASKGDSPIHDTRPLLWCSIDNDDSRDLDQLVGRPATARGRGREASWIAIADVSALVRQGSALDAHTRENTTSVYTAGRDIPDAPGEALNRP